MKAINNYIRAIWHGAGAFALVTFLQEVGPITETWIDATHFAWLAPVLVSVFSVLTAWAKHQEAAGGSNKPPRVGRGNRVAS